MMMRPVVMTNGRIRVEVTEAKIGIRMSHSRFTSDTPPERP